MHSKYIWIGAVALIAAGCAEQRPDADRPAATAYVRPDGKIYTPPEARPSAQPDAPATPITRQAEAQRFGVVDSIRYVKPHVDDPNAIPAGSEVASPSIGMGGNPLPGNAGATREIAKEREQSREQYQIRVRLPDGSYRTVFRESLDGVQVGDRIPVPAEGAAPN
jgi:hypothetical protein